MFEIVDFITGNLLLIMIPFTKTGEKVTLSNDATLKIRLNHHGKKKFE